MNDGACPERSRRANWPTNWLTSVSTTQKEVTRTVYDLSIGDTDVDDMFIDGQQNYLRKRVSTVMYYNDLADGDYQYASHYSYDVHGNVNEFVREYKPLDQFDQRFKKFEYIYDLVSGNTNQMKYQPSASTSSGLAVDGFVHKYEYDADNRLQWVSTTRDGLTWDNDAKYYYYTHGPLARMETGEHKVQGCDYAYTINGLLKGENSAALSDQMDMGSDGKTTNLSAHPYWNSTYNDMHKWTARDAFGYAIGYFGNDTLGDRDYTSITATTNGNRWLCKIPTALGDNLYNGNIRHVVLGLLDENESAVRNRATAYKHDQLQRLKHTYNYYNTGNDYSSITSASWTYLRENVWYDPNGNIDSLQRYDDNATTPALMDEFKYHYNGNTNKLNYVMDHISTPGISTDKETQSANNYAYDEIGQLTADNGGGLTSIGWNVRNKVDTILKADGTKIYFEYDEMGHRIKKEVQSGSENNWTQQWYVLDPQGNPVAVYEHKYTNPSGNTYDEMIDLKEHQIYGSDRLGTRQYTDYHLWEATFTCSSFNVDHTFHSPSGKTELDIAASTYQQNKRITGNKYYELKNHTNNIQAVITDYKKPYAASCSGVTNVDYYTADVKTYTDYFVFGGTMNNRYTGGNAYRYGFQGQERDNEIKGDDNSINFEFRMHDPQYGRFLSIDPLASDYPYNSPYAFSENRVIDAIELEGKEASISTTEGEKNGATSTHYYEYQGSESNENVNAVTAHGDRGKEIWKDWETGKAPSDMTFDFAHDAAKAFINKYNLPLDGDFSYISYNNEDVRYTYEYKGLTLNFTGDDYRAILDHDAEVKAQASDLVHTAGLIADGIFLVHGPGGVLSPGGGGTGETPAIEATTESEVVASTTSAQLATNSIKLANQLASEAQMAEKGITLIVSGKLKEAARLAKEYGGVAADWVKKSSSSYTNTKTGQKFETHWYENVSTGKRIEYKTKFP